MGTLLATPVWQASALSTTANKVDYIQQHVILCEIPKVNAAQLEALLPHSHCLALSSPQEDIATRYSEYALVCFERLQKILKGKPRGKALIQIVVADDQEQPIFAGLSGLLKNREFRKSQYYGSNDPCRRRRHPQTNW